MLLVPTVLRPSPIHGIGLFASAFIPKGTKVWTFDSRIDRVYSDAEFNVLPPLSQELLRNYGIYYKAGRIWILAGDDARFVNHSEKATILSSTGFSESFASFDILPDEEITDDYRSICDDFRTNGFPQKGKTP